MSRKRKKKLNTRQPNTISFLEEKNCFFFGIYSWNFLLPRELSEERIEKLMKTRKKNAQIKYQCIIFYVNSQRNALNARHILNFIPGFSSKLLMLFLLVCFVFIIFILLKTSAFSGFSYILFSQIRWDRDCFHFFFFLHQNLFSELNFFSLVCFLGLWIANEIDLKSDTMCSIIWLQLNCELIGVFDWH